MPYPAVSDFALSLSYPRLFLRMLTDISLCRDPYNDPISISGGNSVVFKAVVGETEYALKCYTEQTSRIREICGYLESIDEKLTIKTRYFPEEIFVSSHAGEGQWCGVCLSKWSDGHTLDFEIRKALKDRDCGRLRFLADMFDDFALELLGREWAHGDLKPENIIVDSSGSMKLTDLDALYTPLFEGMGAAENGTCFYQHPSRTLSDYGKHIDDYPISLIAASLHSLANNPELAASFGNRDIYLLNPVEINNGKSLGYAKALSIAAESADPLTYGLLRKLKTPHSRIERLKDIFEARINQRNGIGHKREDRDFYVERYGDLWGYADENGYFHIEPVFDMATEFSDGLALVMLDGKHHYIDKLGAVAINGSGLADAKPFKNGEAVVIFEDRTKGVLDTAGNRLR